MAHWRDRNIHAHVVVCMLLSKELPFPEGNVTAVLQSPDKCTLAAPSLSSFYALCIAFVSGFMGLQGHSS